MGVIRSSENGLVAEPFAEAKAQRVDARRGENMGVMEGHGFRRIIHFEAGAVYAPGTVKVTVVVEHTDTESAGGRELMIDSCCELQSAVIGYIFEGQLPVTSSASRTKLSM